MIDNLIKVFVALMHKSKGSIYVYE